MLGSPEDHVPPEDQLPLFNQLFNFGEKHGEDEEKGVNMDILVDENEEDAIPPAQVGHRHRRGNSPLPMSAVLACMKEPRRYWDKPFHHQGSLWPGDC